MGSIEIDDRLFPLVRQVLHPGLDDDAVLGMEASFEALWAQRRGRYALLVVPDDGALPSAKIRKDIAAWEERNRDRIALQCVAAAVVLDSGLQRGAFTALSWIRSPATPFRAVPNSQQGIEWCMQQLEASGVGPSPALQAYCDEIVA